MCHQIFFKRHGIEARVWGHEYDICQMRLLSQHLPAKEHVDILAINSGIGDSPMQLRSILNHATIQSSLYQVTDNPNFLADIRPWSEQVEFIESSRMLDELAVCFGDKHFDFIMIIPPLEPIDSSERILSILKERLTDDGILSFHVTNSLFLELLKEKVSHQEPILTNDDLKTAQFLSRLSNQFKILSVNGYNDNDISFEDVVKFVEQSNMHIAKEQYSFLACNRILVVAQKTDS